ncbi:MAG: hypothetical protein MdMp014T_1471 [Treponematales bacterium]
MSLSAYADYTHRRKYECLHVRKCGPRVTTDASCTIAAAAIIAFGSFSFFVTRLMAMVSFSTSVFTARPAQTFVPFNQTSQINSAACIFEEINNNISIEDEAFAIPHPTRL